MSPLKVLLALGAVAILIARVVRRSRHGAGPVAATPADVPSLPDRPVPDRPEPAQLPIEGYDQLRAVDIAKSVRTLHRAVDVQQVLDYEDAHNQRVTVFRAAKARLRALESAREPGTVAGHNVSSRR